ncbi:UNVERIFIED_ORG: hypothetical protein ABID33_003323 [Xanthobacter viscosus]|uniref:DUF3168 domain-containing protein n=1 Tax=Xanthobacter autotrophicus TaxID=280 RepID=A0A6C1KKL7_XANAU|nr:DUF3168 domain-containing protein [Xanthobacter autotrophicus]TLX44799.1 DUF3168 domain-containing protein [Xanthobacter autotrophicus]
MTLDPVLCLTKMVRQRLISSPEFLALCPAERVLDSFTETGAGPLVAIGNGDAVPPDLYETWHHRAYLDLDVWTRGEGSAVLCRRITHVITKTLSGVAWAPWQGDGWIVHGLSASVTTDRDTTEADLAHGVVSLDAIMQEVAQ